MFNALKKFFSDRICVSFHTLGGKVNRIINHKNGYCLSEVHKGKSEDYFISDSFVNKPKPLPPKFDSIADRLMADIPADRTRCKHDQQQLFLQPVKSSRYTHLKYGEVIEQLKQLIELLLTVTSEQEKTESCNISFLREVIHNIYLDLQVLLANLDIELMLESDTQKDWN